MPTNYYIVRYITRLKFKRTLVVDKAVGDAGERKWR
jgi:hypothetical protein